ncbi:MAG: hypothetical protein GY803_10765 [Chloroflexi bacterium]|nr:hypothetical protein [Chloroflexota bacterium]
MNLYFWVGALSLMATDAHIVIPAQIFFAVSAFRCIFPVRYKDNIVFHNFPLSSIFLTRLLATFSEIALIYQLAYLLRLINSDQTGWVNILSWLMLAQVAVSQVFVWGAILSVRLRLFFYEELGWAFIYAANAIASAYLYAASDNLGGRELLLLLNLIFGAGYLPWQFIHLRGLLADARHQERERAAAERMTWRLLRNGFHRAIMVKNQTSAFRDWGGWVGMVWMASYWAILMPTWVFLIVLKG